MAVDLSCLQQRQETPLLAFLNHFICSRPPWPEQNGLTLTGRERPDGESAPPVGPPCLPLALRRPDNWGTAELHINSKQLFYVCPKYCMGHTLKTYSILLAQLWQRIHWTYGSAVIPGTSGSVWTQSQKPHTGPQLSLSHGLLGDPHPDKVTASRM